MSTDVPPRDDDEFFIGWAAMPAAHGRAARRIAGVLLLLALGVGATSMLTSRDPGPGSWDLDAVQSWNGVLRVAPYAVLELDGRAGTALLVEAGKRGAWERASAYDGRAVSVRGAPIERSGRLMIELLPDDDAITVRTAGGDAGAPLMADAVDLGPVVLRGEILDSKCHLGAMRPGDGKTHKACATLCIDGGIPPLLITRRDDGLEYLLLVAPDGGPANAWVRSLVGEPVELSGRLTRHRDLLQLHLAPGGLRRLPPGE